MESVKPMESRDRVIIHCRVMAQFLDPEEYHHLISVIVCCIR